MAAVTDAFFRELEWRGFLEGTTGEDVEGFLAESRRTMYVGFDPTADSLHLGSLIPVMALAHAQRHGHRPLALVGGGTGLIGDPSGKTAERTLLTAEKAHQNAEGIRRQLAKFFDLSSPERGLLLNNAEWLVPLNFVEFLRDIGKHFSVNEMVKRDSVRIRLEERDQGISYTEFSYMLLQAYDFLHLCQHHDCTVQMGGRDQWGNILSGMDLIRRILGKRSEGITFPLLTTSSGKKFGKTEEGAVWLDAERTSPYQLYQYWLQTADQDVVRYLKLFTFLQREQIGELEAETAERPEGRVGQKALAAECVGILHGSDNVKAVEGASGILFGNWDAAISEDTVRTLAAEIPTSEVGRAELAAGIGLAELLVRSKLADSKGAARKLIEGGGAYLNNDRQTSVQRSVRLEDVRMPGAILLRSGKKSYHLALVR
ncbi:MAG: tyrosine--tRNA ligase [Acidobacteriota bacterium]